MLPAGLEELLEADPLDRGIIVDMQPIPRVVGAAHRDLVDLLCQDHSVLDLSYNRFLPMINSLLVRFSDAALGLLDLRLQLLGQLLDLMSEYGLQHQVIATRSFLCRLRDVHAERTYLMRSARVLLGARPRGSELFLRVFDGLRVGKRRAGLVHSSDVTVVSQDLIIVGLVIGMESSPSSVLRVLATKAEGVCPHIVIKDARWVCMR